MSWRGRWLACMDYMRICSVLLEWCGVSRRKFWKWKNVGETQNWKLYTMLVNYSIFSKSVVFVNSKQTRRPWGSLSEKQPHWGICDFSMISQPTVHMRMKCSCFCCSVAKSCLTLQPHPSLSPRVCSNSCPLSGDAITKMFIVLTKWKQIWINLTLRKIVLKSSFSSNVCLCCEVQAVLWTTDNCSCCCSLAQSHLTLCDPTNHSMSGSSVLIVYSDPRSLCKSSILNTSD